MGCQPTFPSLAGCRRRVHLPRVRAIAKMPGAVRGGRRCGADLGLPHRALIPEVSLSETQPRYARTRERYLAWLASVRRKPRCRAASSTRPWSRCRARTDPSVVDDPEIPCFRKSFPSPTTLCRSCFRKSCRESTSGIRYFRNFSSRRTSEGEGVVSQPPRGRSAGRLRYFEREQIS